MQKILIITHRSIRYGMGHFSRSLNIKNTLERYYKVSMYLFKDEKEIKKKKGFFNLLRKKDLLVIDLPKKLILKSKVLNLNKKILFLDFVHKKKNFYSILSSIRQRNFKKIKSGFDFIPLTNNINQINKKKSIRSKEIIIFPGSSTNIPKKISTFYKRNKKIYKFKIISKIKQKGLSSKETSKLLNYKKFLEKIKFSRGILMRFGATTYEAISLGVKPIIWVVNEKKDRLNEILFLQKKNLVSVFSEKAFAKSLTKKNKIKKINHLNFIKFIKQILES